MLKKIGMVTALSAAFIFGGAFDTVDAESYNSHQVYYSINGEIGSLNGEEAQAKINNLLNKFMKKYNVNWDNYQSEPVPKEEPKQNEQPKQEKTENPVSDEPAEEQVNEPVPEQAEETEQEQSADSELSQFEQEVVELTNQERAKHGLSSLQIDTELSKVAREKSRDMAADNYFDHNSPTYGSPFDMMKSFGVTYRTAGENIAKGQRTPAEVVNGWMNSEGHRANILNENFTHIGVGYVEQGNHWTQQFIGK
ncbi:CAP domain-containing protein [Oceanobacillus halophilus]|uniref:Sporulation protein n=1 Tax=Oceanobacillus halophilus TaxID=930130 RepID=A0A494ZXE7_9BACI|nr:CAP domain-containing protein [Oceanobacillus halophilus]RKQ31368.1 sporulation protein [Oceanobacillus halophilus]